MLQVASSFGHHENVPRDFTCEGKNLSPELKISGIPKGAKTLAVVCDDPDAPAGTFTHWVLWNYPVRGDTVVIPEGVPKVAKLPNGAMQGINDFGRFGYDGPCPPKGHGTHHYHFKVYALDVELQLSGSVKKRDLEKAMEGHVLAKGELVGLYRRD